MNILVAGASGFIGKCLLKTLEESNHQVVALYKGSPLEATRQVFPVMLDLENYQNLRTILRNIDTVVYLAWDHRPYENGDFSIETSQNLRSLNCMITAMEELNVKKIVFLSSFAANEKSPNMFLKDKYYGETLVLNSNLREKLVIKADIVWDDTGDYFLSGLRQLMNFPVFPILNQNQKTYLLHVSDISRYIAKKITESGNQGSEIRFCLGNDMYLMGDIFKSVRTLEDVKISLPIRGWLANPLRRMLEETRLLKMKQQFYEGYFLHHNINEILVDKLGEKIIQKRSFSEICKEVSYKESQSAQINIT